MCINRYRFDNQFSHWTKNRHNTYVTREGQAPILITGRSFSSLLHQSWAVCLKLNTNWFTDQCSWQFPFLVYIEKCLLNRMKRQNGNSGEHLHCIVKWWNYVSLKSRMWQDWNINKLILLLKGITLFKMKKSHGHLNRVTVVPKMDTCPPKNFKKKKKKERNHMDT